MELDSPKIIKRSNNLNVWFVPLFCNIDPLELYTDNTPEQQADLICKLDNYRYVVFDAKVYVTPYFAGDLVLGTEYLCGCVYESFDDFLTESSTLDELVDSAMNDANTTIHRLKFEVTI